MPSCPLDERLTRLSKSMAYLLRHKPPDGAMDSSGWMQLSVLLRHLPRGTKETDVRAVVDCNDKKRFVLDDESEPARIRAAQGHSIQLENPVLQPVTSAEDIPLALHATSRDSWHSIQQHGCLLRMRRTHIHFATQPHHMRKNSWVGVMLLLDLQGALDAGHQFFLSENHVLLCPGPLPMEFVHPIAHKDLPPDWQ